MSTLTQPGSGTTATIVRDASNEEKEKFERAEFARRKKEIKDIVMKDAQDPNTTTILFMNRRISEILFQFVDNGKLNDLAINLNQDELRDIRLVEIRIMLPYLKILYIPKDETKPETALNYNIDGNRLSQFEMTYVDHCTDCGNPRNPIDRTVAI